MVQQDINLLPKIKKLLFIFSLIVTATVSGCGKRPVSKTLTATAYCGCAKCCSWERGNPALLHLDFWNKYVSSGKNKGARYSGLTASGTKPHQPQKGFFSWDTIQHPWMIPIRIILFPWYFLPEDGTLAADTRYYPFGTRMYIPGYGWGLVEDRGAAIKGPAHIDLYYGSHHAALSWGRRRVNAIIYKP